MNQPHEGDLYEDFAEFPLSPRLRWQSEPARWHVDASTSSLVIEPDEGTDFWQRAHYGYQADNGHFLYAEVAGQFDLTTEVAWYPVNQYDQAGLMVRVSEACWLKTSVEFEPNSPSRLSAVVTNMQFSDWSSQSLARDVTRIWLRIIAEACDFRIDWSRDGREWQMLRLAHLHRDGNPAPLRCGLYACSPKGAGYRAEFTFLQVARPADRT